MSKLYHLYFAACKPEGGIYHYTLKDGNLTFIKKTDISEPMYMDITDNDLEVVLRRPCMTENGPVSGLQHYDLVNYELSNPSGIQPTGGREGCHLCRFEGNFYVANYSSGSLFSSAGKLVEHEGQGPDPRRQERPHIHYVYPSPDNKYLLSVDLGLDSVFTYDKDLNEVSVSKVPGGYGCRHLAYSEDGKYVFCANELDASVSVFAYDDGKLEYIDTTYMYDTHPIAGNTTGAIRVKGEYVYVTNRSKPGITNDITVLKWDKKALTKVNQVPSGGESPRDIFLVDGLLFCTNEYTNNVTIYKENGAELIKLDEELSMPNPLNVVVLEEK